jgi:hypothetical protein
MSGSASVSVKSDAMGLGRPNTHLGLFNGLHREPEEAFNGMVRRRTPRRAVSGRHVNSLLLNLQPSQNTAVSHGRTYAVSHGTTHLHKILCIVRVELGGHLIVSNWWSYTQAEGRGALRGQGGPRRVGVVVTTGKLATCSFRRDVLARARKIDT